MIIEQADGSLQHFNWLGFIVIAVLLVSATLMYFLHKAVPEGPALTPAVAVSATAE